MPDYKEMYLTMVRAREDAINMLDKTIDTLIVAQQKCEELYLASPGPELTILKARPQKIEEKASLSEGGGTAKP